MIVRDFKNSSEKFLRFTVMNTVVQKTFFNYINESKAIIKNINLDAFPPLNTTQNTEVKHN